MAAQHVRVSSDHKNTAKRKAIRLLYVKLLPTVSSDGEIAIEVTALRSGTYETIRDTT